MANLVKTKSTIASISLVVLILIPLLESSFMRPVILKRWSKLTWDDFQGIARPWSGHDAAINSDIYLDYDSTLKRLHAYAAQSNVESWVDGDYEPGKPDYLLIHEQYHFNITEIMARRADNWIAKNRGDEQGSYLEVSYRKDDLWRMQSMYDRETNHSTMLHRQRRWEFKIDSLLKLEKGWVVDEYSGASIFLPAESELTFKKGVTKGFSKQRFYTINAYGVDFTLISMQHPNYDDSAIFRIVRDIRRQRSTAVLSTEYPHRVYFRSKGDSTERRTYASYIYDGSNVFYVGATFSPVLGDTTGYYEIANSVIKSFKVTDMDSAWIKAKESPVKQYSTIRKKNNDDKVGYQQCVVNGNSVPVGFLTKPIFFDSLGSVQLSCDFSATPDSLRLEDFIQIGDRLYSYEPDDKGQVFYFDARDLKGDVPVYAGYFLKEDTTKKCYRGFREHVHLRRE